VPAAESLRRQARHRLTRRGQIAVQTAKIIMIRGRRRVVPEVMCAHQSCSPAGGRLLTRVETLAVQDFFPPVRRV
jgi:hypothetical protein